MPLTMLRQDITRMRVDAIVSADDSELSMGGGVSSAILKAAGEAELKAACKSLAPIGVGEAVATPGFALPCKYVIHTVGPVYHWYSPKRSAQLLRDVYTSCMALAVEKGCESVAFPLIAGGSFGYPKDEALSVALSAIRDFLDKCELEVYLLVFSDEAFAVGEKLLGSVESYIDAHYVSEHSSPRSASAYDIPRPGALPDGRLQSPATARQPRPDRLFERGAFSRRRESLNAPPSFDETCDDAFYSTSDMTASLDELVGHLDEPFSAALLRLIDAKGRSDVEVYKRANIDRKLFSKIRSRSGYMPSKRTVIALAVALELNMDETADLLERAGFALSRSQKFDVIISYFISRGSYDIFTINAVLFQFDQPLLGG